MLVQVKQVMLSKIYLQFHNKYLSMAALFLSKACIGHDEVQWVYNPSTIKAAFKLFNNVLVSLIIWFCVLNSRVSALFDSNLRRYDNEGFNTLTFREFLV